MSISRDPDDTANQNSVNDGTTDMRALRADDTDQLLITEARRRYREQGEKHPFAEGIIRFYRARTILEGDDDGTRWSRAWRYLDRLSPHDLPPSTRQEFFELVYFMQEQTGQDEFELDEFRSQVRAIANMLDSFVDDMNSDLDS